ncbi:MAG TPA: hypothetical protein VMA37_10440 [Acetobacteraceae bacterium]|nr:hypothetical protein [Acetobacteraceae bacterium]
MNMRRGFVIAAVLVLAAPWARGQVSVNMNALNALTPAPAPKPGPSPVPMPRGEGVRAQAMPAGPLPLPPIPPSGPVPPAPQFATVGSTTIGPLPSPPPQHPPAKPVLAPIVLVGPPHPEPPPTPPQVVDGAPGQAMRIPGGVRVTFGATDAALNPATLAALREIAGAAVEAHAPSVAVDAYAKSDPSDPSTARRLSLSRALAAQAVLREAGIASEHIYVRALLSEAGPAPLPANRVDVTFQPGPKAPQAAEAAKETPKGAP